MRAQGSITSTVLLSGVVLSFLLLAAGTAAHLRDAAAGGNLIQAGLVVLIATPFVRILVLMFEFLRRGEVAFVMMGIGVLLLLGVSVWIGLA